MTLSTVSRRMLGMFAGACALAVATAAPAQETFPSRPITLVVPFAAGGSTDIVARLIATKMSQSIGQQVIVENRAGAGGGVGALAVSRANPDGYTILMGTVATHALNPLMSKKATYDPVTAFEPISLLGVVPNVLIVNSKLPVNSVKDLVELLKKEPGKYSYASSGVATPLHLSGVLFRMLSKTDMTHLPYAGAGPALNDLIGGHVPIMFDNLPSAIGAIRSGTVKALGVTTAKRSKSAPDIPTVAEAGLPGYETYTWNALFAPAKTPKPVLEKLAAEAKKALADPTVQARFAELSVEVVGSGPEELRDYVKAELAKWTPITKESGASLD